MITLPGIHSLPAADYHADPAPLPSLSSSIAKTLLTQSPLHAWMQHPRLNRAYVADQDSRFDIGSAAHMMLLERRSDGIVIVEADDWRTKAAKEARDNARANGQYPVLAKVYERLNKMLASAQAFIARTELSGILELGHAEQTVLWQEGPIWCRCRPDLLSADRQIILDYKTTESAEPEMFIRQIGRMGYDVQAEFYTRGTKAVTDIEPTFVFLAQEITPPYACSLVALSNAYRAIAQPKVARSISTWTECISTGKWPSYRSQIHYAEPRAWELMAMDENQNETTSENLA